VERWWALDKAGASLALAIDPLLDQSETKKHPRNDSKFLLEVIIR
jgi:hypothetical protein